MAASPGVKLQSSMGRADAVCVCVYNLYLKQW